MDQLEAKIIVKLQDHIRSLIGKWAIAILTTVGVCSYIASANWSDIQSRVKNVEAVSKANTSDMAAVEKQYNVIDKKIGEVSTDIGWIKDRLSNKNPLSK